MIANYSQEEVKLFTALGFLRRLEEDINEVDVYQMAVEHVFRKNMYGTAVDALRRAYNAMRNCTAYRLTDAWDKLIAFDGAEPKPMPEILGEIKTDLSYFRTRSCERYENKAEYAEQVLEYFGVKE